MDIHAKANVPNCNEVCIISQIDLRGDLTFSFQ